MTRPWLELNNNQFGVRKLAHVGRLKARIGWQNLRTEEFVDEGPHCVTGTDFQDGEINWTNSYHVTPDRYEVDQNIKLENNDLLITKDGTIGKVAVVRNMPGPATLNSGIFLFRAIGEGVHSPYMKWVIQSKVFDDFVTYNSTGSTINHLYQNVFEQFRFPYPDLSTQKAIADFLDREIARINQLIEKKQRLAEILTKNRTIVTLHVLDQFGAPPMGAAAETYFTGHFEDGWSVQRVKHVVKYMTSGSRGWSSFLANEGELFLQSGNIGRNMEVNLKGAQRVLPQTGAEAERTRLKTGDVLVCITGGRTGAVGYLEDLNEPAYVNQHICLLRAHSSLIEPKILSHLLYSEIGQKQLEFFQYGLKQGLGFAQVGEVKIPVPPKENQKALLQQLEDRVERIDRIIECITMSVERLREFRSALITAAVTGQIDVATWGKRGETDRRLDRIEEAMAS